MDLCVSLLLWDSSCEHELERHEIFRLGFPSESVVSIRLEPNYWSAAPSIRSLPLRSPASLTIEQLAWEQHLLMLLGRCCCWPSVVVVVEMLLSVVEHHCCSQWLAPGWYITSYQPVSSPASTPYPPLSLYSYLLNAGAMAGRFNVSFDIIFKLSQGFNLIRISRFSRLRRYMNCIDYWHSCQTQCLIRAG